MTEKYFKLRKDLTINVDEKTLYRIEALQDLDLHGVKKGDLGGYIESEYNLSGNAWVSGNACVSGNAKVSGNACVSDSARVVDNAWVSGNARVSDNAEISGNANVRTDAKVFDDAKVSDNALVSCDAEVSGNANVSDSARVVDNARVSGNSHVLGTAYVSGNSQVSGDATVDGNCSLWAEIIELLKNNNKQAEDIRTIHLRGRRLSIQTAALVLSKISLLILDNEHKQNSRDREGLNLDLIISGNGFIIRSEESHEYWGTVACQVFATYQNTFLDYIDLPETIELPKTSVLRKMRDAKSYTENVNLFYQLWE